MPGISGHGEGGVADRAAAVGDAGAGVADGGPWSRQRAHRRGCCGALDEEGRDRRMAVAISGVTLLRLANAAALPARAGDIPRPGSQGPPGLRTLAFNARRGFAPPDWDGTGLKRMNNTSTSCARRCWHLYNCGSPHHIAARLSGGPRTFAHRTNTRNARCPGAGLVGKYRRLNGKSSE